MKKVGVAILGLGVVGTGTYRILTEKKQYFRDTQGLDVTVEAVLEPRRAHALEVGVPEEVICSNISEVVGNPAVDIVVECIGGVEPGLSFLITALKSGKTCVTSNKELFSKNWQTLEAQAKKTGAGVYFEATSMGGVPVVRVLTDGMQANCVQKICGIINGTTNFILTKMDEGMTFDAALAEAKALGYAEANPSMDVDGFDSMYKLSILAGLAFHQRIGLDQIERKGITEIKKEDVDFAKELGYTVKLLAVAKRTEGGIEARVQPALVPLSHPLANVKDCFNGILIIGDSVGAITLTGRGAGAGPTGSAIVSDVIYAAKRLDRTDAGLSSDAKISAEVTSGHYLHFTASGAEMVGKVASRLSKCGVSVEKVLKKDADGKTHILVVTAEGEESSVKKAVEKLKEYDVELSAAYRIEDLSEHFRA